MLAKAVLVRPPEWIVSNPETAATNAYQVVGDEQDRAIAQRQFRAFCTELGAVGIDVVEMPAGAGCPDAVFPNNWFSTHEDGKVAIYPMMAESRRRERDLPLLTQKLSGAGFEVSEILDFTDFERAGHFLEGTGSLVIDHWSRIAYACLSARTHREAVITVCDRMKWRPVIFEARDSEMPVYHTNVVMGVASDFAVVCAEAITAHDAVMSALQASGRSIVEISRQQMRSFCGNIIELAGPTVLMSNQAREAFHPDQLAVLGRNRKIISPDISAIERLGGGSARCMVAEIFLPRS